MDREEAREKVIAIMGALKGHPPGDPRDRLRRIEEILGVDLGIDEKKRKERKGRDRMADFGFDRSE